MVPETLSVQAVQLYRAVEFPTRWEYVQDLLSDIELLIRPSANTAGAGIYSPA